MVSKKKHIKITGIVIGARIIDQVKKVKVIRIPLSNPVIILVGIKLEYNEKGNSISVVPNVLNFDPDNPLIIVGFF